MVLLAQRPGFGKTTLMLELCTRERFAMVFAPTKPLQQQVNAVTRANANSSNRSYLLIKTQIIKDLQQKGVPCASMHTVMEQSAQVAVANNCVLVGIFDQIPDSAKFVIEARSCEKTCLLVIDEVHQVLQEKWRLVINRAWELGSKLKQHKVACPWLLLSGTLRPEEDQPLAEALCIPRIHTVLRGNSRTDNLTVEVSVISSYYYSFRWR